MTAAEKLLSRAAIATGMSSAEMNLLAAGLKDRAIWSARVGSVRHVQAFQRKIADMLDSLANSDGAVTTRAHVVSDIMRTARQEGLATGYGGLTDPGSAERAAVIADTNAGLAAGYADYAAGSTPGALAAFPAQELIRVEQRDQERDWDIRWNQARADLGEGATTATYATSRRGPFVALKGDPIWAAISRFGNPFPPFDYGSGMGVADVSRADAVSLGIIGQDYAPASTPIEDFNARLQESITFNGAQDPAWLTLKDSFGDQIAYRDGSIRWRGGLIDDMLAKWQENPNTSAADTVRLGAASPRAAALSPALQGRGLKLSAGNAGHISKRHVGPNDTDPRNIPLTKEELRLIPTVWRSPDRILPADGGALDIIMDTLDNAEYHLIIAPNRGGQSGWEIKTFYKKKK